jgi:uncharacterized membrane protein YcaP (DUF421 family)
VFDLDLQALFGFSVNPLELVLRGSFMYWLLFVLFRFVIRRGVGAIGIADVLLLVLIADAASNGMAGGYETLGEGSVLVLTIAAWNYGLDWGSSRSPALRRLLEPAPLLLVKNGRLLRKHMRQQFITTDELWAQLRLQGVKDLAEVKSAFIEPDGEISVLKADASHEAVPPERKLP